MLGRRNFLRFSNFIDDESGVATVWSLGFTIVFIMIGGLAIDVGNAFRDRNLLQATADAAALAGVHNINNATTARADANAIALANMPVANFGTVLDDANILIGTWNHSTRVFTETNVNPDAIRVLARQETNNGNPVATFFLKLIALDRWNISAAATAQGFYRQCHHDGMIAGGTVQLSSNNSFVNNYCIHGEQGVQVSSNNTFQNGVKVTMYDLDDFQMPNSGFQTNTGLQPALGEDFIRPVLALKAAAIVTSLGNPASNYQPANVSPSSTVVTHAKNSFNSGNLVQNRVNTVTCSGNQQIAINTNVSNVVFVTNCRINFGTGVVLTNSVFATSSTVGNSVLGGQNMQLGANDNCADGGGSQIVTAGGVSFPAGSKLYGSQVISGENIHIAAQGNGIQGSSFQAAGDIQQTSNGGFGLCNGNTDPLTKVISYRLVD
jgi:hypothetical protein